MREQRKARTLGLAVLLVGVGTGSALAAANEQPPPAEGPAPVRAQIVRAAEQHLRSLYVVYLAIKGCTEASREEGTPEYLPSVTLEKARSILSEVDTAAQELQLDVNEAWLAASPIGQITAEDIKVDQEIGPEKCRRVGATFKTVLGDLEETLTALGSRRLPIRRNF